MKTKTIIKTALVAALMAGLLTFAVWQLNAKEPRVYVIELNEYPYKNLNKDSVINDFIRNEAIQFTIIDGKLIYYVKVFGVFVYDPPESSELPIIVPYGNYLELDTLYHEK